MRPFVDTHFHVYRYSEELNAGQLSAEILRRDFTMADYRAAIGELPLSTAIGVQVYGSRNGLPELAFMRSVAASDRLLSHYVGWLPVDDPGCSALIENLGDDPFVVGVRYSEAIDADGTLRRGQDAIRGARALARAGLVYDISVRPRQYDGLAAFAAATGDTQFVLCHMGKPHMTIDEPEWPEKLSKLAALPNIACKVTACVLEPDDPPYERDAVLRRVRHAVDCFGPKRIMFGSNYPTCLISSSLREWAEVVDEALSGFGDVELDDFYAGNARRIYGLDSEP